MNHDIIKRFFKKMPPHSKINVFKLRQWITKTKNLTLDQKRYFLGNFEQLNQSQIQELYDFSIQPERKKEADKFIDSPRGKKIKLLLKIGGYLGAFALVWSLYASPSGISVRAFPGSVWVTRVALNELQEKMPRYYDLVKNNIDILDFEYIVVSGRFDGYAQELENGDIKVSLLTQHKLKSSYLAGELVHEACHGKQFHDKRINMRGTNEQESRQKIEHECLLLQIHTMEVLKDEPSTIKYFKATGRGTGPYGDTWMKSWKDGDTSNGLMELLPQEKRVEWNVPGFEDKEASTKKKIKKEVKAKHTPDEESDSQGASAINIDTKDEPHPPEEEVDPFLNDKTSISDLDIN